MSNTVVGLDIGTSFVRAVIGTVNDDKSVEIIDVAKKASSGFLRNGTIVNIEAAKQCIHEVIDELEQRTGFEVRSCVTGIGGVQIESLNSKGAVAISSYGKSERAITADDVKRVIDCANSVKYPPDRKLLHVIPQQFIIDGTGGFKNPVNNIAYRLEADVHIITASRTSVQNIQTCVDQANYQLDEVMLKTLACTEAVMLDEEKKLGSILIDIGGGTTDVIIIFNDAPICTFSIPIGGNLVTNDVAVVKGIQQSMAEKIKIESGCCWLPLVENENSEVLIPGFGSRTTELTTKVELCNIIYPRMEEIFTMVRDEISQRFSSMQLSGSIILTGGGAQINGAVEMAQSVFGTSSVRLGYPQSLGGIEEHYRMPEFATAVGLVLAHGNHVVSEPKNPAKKRASGTKKEGDGAFQKFLKKFF
ncbi:MAG: cell division protein FtsA [Treponema sp.]|nr:cell division protein FtsA [Treponema sp.]